MLHVRIGNVDFLGFTASGFLIGPDGFKGWEGAPATRRAGIDRAGQHGAFSTPTFKAGRLVALSGHALANSEAELEHLGEVLSGVGQSEQTIAVQSAQGYRWGRGSVEGEVKFDRVGEATEATWSLSLFMPDPFKYGETRESGSSGANVSAFHRGNTAAVPRFKVAGLWSGGYRIRGPQGQSFSVVGTLNSNVVDEVDFRTGMVRRNGVPLTRAVLSPEMWSVPGGAAVQWRVEGIDGGSGSAVMYLTDTFV